MTEEDLQYKKVILQREEENSALTMRNATHVKEVQMLEDNLTELSEKHQEMERRFNQLEKHKEEMKDIYLELLKIKKVPHFYFI